MKPILKKWNYDTHTYDDYESFPGAKCFSDDMNEVVQCAGCGTDIQFGLTYTSIEIHTRLGLGYAVCSKCYSEEWKRRNAHEKQ